MLKLGVNVDHVATVREARYRGKPYGEPDPVEMALLCEEAGAHGITAHLREDRRHIQDRDLMGLRSRVRTRLNLEMALVPEIVEIAVKVKPDIICLVPEHRQEVTTEGGLDVVSKLERVREVCERMVADDIEVSLFITPDADQIDVAARTGAGFIELHTGAYAECVAAGRGADEALSRLAEGAERAHRLGLGVNAGHGLTVANLPALLDRVPHLLELNIGHSLVSGAIATGIAAAVKAFLEPMAAYRLGPG